MNPVSYIKRPRVMSAESWRFRLLHFVFGERGDNNVPNSLYTNYCPLFWITNLIVVLFIPIILLKVIIWFINKFIVNPINRLASLVPKSDKTKELNKLYQKMYVTMALGNSFEYFWHKNSTKCTEYNLKDWWEIQWNQADQARVLEIRGKEEHKKKVAKRFTTAINFTRMAFLGLFIILKIISVAVLVGCVLFLGYEFYRNFWSIWAAFVGLFNWDNAVFATYIAILVSSAVLILYILSGVVLSIRMFAAWLNKEPEVIDETPTRWNRFTEKVKTFFDAMAGFIETVYEDNCPPIEYKE